MRREPRQMSKVQKCTYIREPYAWSLMKRALRSSPENRASLPLFTFKQVLYALAKPAFHQPYIHVMMSFGANAKFAIWCKRQVRRLFSCWRLLHIRSFRLFTNIYTGSNYVEMLSRLSPVTRSPSTDYPYCGANFDISYSRFHPHLSDRYMSSATRAALDFKQVDALNS